MKKPVRMIVITAAGEVGPCLMEDLRGFLKRGSVLGTDMVRQTNGRILGTVESVMARADAPGTAEYMPGPSASQATDTDGIPTAIMSAAASTPASPAGMVPRSATRVVPPIIPADPPSIVSTPSTAASPLTRRIRSAHPMPTAGNQAVAMPAMDTPAASVVDGSEVPAAATSRPDLAGVAKPAVAPRGVVRRRAGIDGATEHRPASSSSHRMVWILGGVGGCFVCIGIAAGLILQSKPIPPPASESGPQVVATAAEQIRQPELLTSPVPPPPVMTQPQPPSSPAVNVPETVVATAAATIHPPEPTPPPQPAPPGPPILLLASEARLQGGLKLENNPPNIGFWIKAQDRATWSVSIDRPGTFSVALEYALDPKGRGNEFTLEVGDRKLTGTLDPTRSWKDYTCSNIGTVAVPSAGAITVLLRPAHQPRAGLMNLHRIILTPARP